MPSKLLRSVALALLAVAMLTPTAHAGGKPPVLPSAEYRGKGTELVITPTGTHVTFYALPIDQKCKGKTPTNLGEFTVVGFGPFEIDADGRFSNADDADFSDTHVKGRFKGKKVTGTVVADAFEDPAKGFDCQKFSGKFSAKLVKGTGLEPGKVLARDDFTDPQSGFEEFNTTNGFGEYLDDGRYRIGLRGPATVTGLRAEPDGVSTVEVEADIFTFGGESTDQVGLVCQAADAQSFLAGFVRQDGMVELLRYDSGEIVERAESVQLPDGVLKTGQGAANELRLVCRSLSASPAETDIELWVNGEQAITAISASSRGGRTGITVAGGGNGTDYNITRYVVRIPEASGR